MTSLTIVLIQLSAICLPLAALARFARVFPGRRLAYLMLIPAAVSLGLVAHGGWLWAVVPIDAGLALAVAVDLASLPIRKCFSVEREVGRVASLAKRHPVSLTLSNHSRRTFEVSVRDGIPHELAPEPNEFLAVGIRGRSRTTFDYRLHPRRRGAFQVSQVHLKVRSRLGIWKQFIDCPARTIVNVYPDMHQLGQYAVLARTNRLSQLGVRRTRRIGMDHDFERLRDYSIDDNYRHIDWRATARRRKLTVKDFQASQSQRIVFVVDCGRMMTNRAAGLSLLDHALNATLMLSFVALRQADSVGLLCFSNEVHGYVPPRGGMNQMNRLLHASFNRFPQLVESRYDLAFRYLTTHVRKRSLVVLITNVIDEVNANQVESYLTHLAGRHLPLGVLLRDRRLFDAVAPENPKGDALWRAAAAADILSWRHQVLNDLALKGALTLDVFPENMTAPLVNRYLEIKARHLL